MSNAALKKLAEELESLATTARPKSTFSIKDYFGDLKSAPHVTLPSKRREEDVAAIVRSLLGYTIHRVPDGATAQQIGEAIAAGIRAASDEFSIKRERLFEALKSHLEQMVTATRNDLLE